LHGLKFSIALYNLYNCQYIIEKVNFTLVEDGWRIVITANCRINTSISIEMNRRPQRGRRVSVVCSYVCYFRN